MRVAVVGAGGIGTPLGASLALAGENVSFVARGSHLAAMWPTGCKSRGTAVKALSGQSGRPTIPQRSARSIWFCFA